ncbi:hypothetical protein J6524_17690 [Bradyrhizobium sp. WSM 1738]|uniref:hydrogenase maturation nickel metallochaperone HypA n=1 Tax=Bradyrhizobium hereditatis TaxID=2821405 RepID=UPI001CE2F226|nr:hydrogenase maturation nickel metallochaperone HypA [Bradyrhizobium hereditatis]MCA6116718.1 hypothetical protein [Bradyrhizobium hereditatis]
MSLDANGQVEEAIDLAEARSACTCEVCGEVGVLRGGGWLTTRCYRYAEGRPPAEVRPASRTSASSGTASAISAGPPADATTGRTMRSWTSIPPTPESRRNGMTRFRCRACGQEGDFVYDPKRHECPRCGSREVQFRAPDQLVYEIIESLSRAEPLDREGEED